MKRELCMDSWGLILRLLVAGALGAVVGIEREWRVKEAGFRTHFLVAMGSALFMIVSQWGFEEFILRYGAERLDPSRIAAQVVSGIGFIGAGAIIFHRQIVRGLTTAASLWAISGVGLATGAGLYGVAVAATLLTLFGLELLNVIFRNFGAHRTSLVLSSMEREALREGIVRLREGGVSIISLETERQRLSADEVIYRATMIIQNRGELHTTDSYLSLLGSDKRIMVERIE